MATRKSTQKIVHLPLFPEASYEKRLYYRDCPSCGATISHTEEGNRNKAEKNKTICRDCDNARRVDAYTGEANLFYGKKHTAETIAKFRARKHPHTQTEEFKAGASKRRLEWNPMRGSSVYELWVKKFGKDKADELMDQRRIKTSQASSGENNPMFGKPSPHGSGNGWSGWYNGWFFRSLRELSYMVNVIEREGLQWETAESTRLKIPYADWRGKSRTYTADFLISERILVEIKPRRLHESPAVLLKQAAAMEFCEKNGFEYRLIDCPPLLDSEIIEMHDSGKVKFTDRYESKFKERFNR